MAKVRHTRKSPQSGSAIAGKISGKLSGRLSGKITSLLRGVSLILLLTVVAYLFVCLVTYSPDDPGPTHTGSGTDIANMGGMVGAWLADLLFTSFGTMAYLFATLLGIMVWRIHKDYSHKGHIHKERGVRKSHRENRENREWRYFLSITGLLAAMIGASSLEQIYFPFPYPEAAFHAGGIIGQFSAQGLIPNFGIVGSTVILIGLLIAGITLVGRVAWLDLMDKVGYGAFMFAGWVKLRVGDSSDRKQGIKVRQERQASVKKIRAAWADKGSPRIEPKIDVPAQSGRTQKEQQVSLFTEKTAGGELPELALLDRPAENNQGYSRAALEAMSQVLIKKLKDFNVDITVESVQPGPVITRFEIEPAPGIKASQIVGLSRDLARSLSVISVRVVENIPGKTVIGIEIPNQHREIVRLVEGLASQQYEKSISPLTLVLGKDIAGNAVVADIIKMPHILIAGTTGSGKSVCINALILSLIYKSTPEQVRMIMVDPKFLELSVYDGIPHLLAPVVTDMNKAANALRWCIVEMDRRFRLMAAVSVRNIAGFNKKVEVANEAGEFLFDPTQELEAGMKPDVLGALPYIVVIVDELADLMMVAGKKIEEIITRIAQRARAAGIHLVLATQRPSVDVVTGLIKANVPTRIAFQVSSRVDSRTVLDQMGAEQLLGQGDMLFLPPGSGFAQRVHGSFVSDNEVAKVVEKLKKAAQPVYLNEITEGDTESFGGEGSFAEGESDPLYDEAVSFVTQSRKASISAVQRALRVGYNRAARMIETMEQSGVISTSSNGKREVLAPPAPEN